MNHDAPTARNGLGTRSIRPTPAGDLRLAEPEADHVDALADLFLTDAPLGPKRSPDARATGQPAPRAAKLERVVLGNLPVMPSAWIAQYARHTAQQLGEPVAVLRLDAAHASLDVVTPAGLEESTATPVPTSPHATLAEAISSAAAQTTRWIVRAGDDFVGDAVTLLTASDEAATVAAYRTLKELDDTQPTVTSLRAVVLGPTIDAARIACDRISAAADAFLGTPIETEPCLAKLDALATVTLFDNRSTHSAEQIVAAIREATRAPRMVAAPASQAEQPPQRSITSTAEPSAAGAASSSLDARTTLGLEPIDLECPIAPGVLLARDESGVLHLVASAIADDAPEPAAAILTAARCWAIQHAALLAKAEPGLAAAQPVVHLVTDRPKGVMGLGGSDIRLHAAARVGDAWGTVALF